MLVLVAAGVGTLAGWLLLGQRAANGVKVAWNVVSCTGTHSTRTGPLGNDVDELAIVVAPAMDCEVTVRVTSQRPVRLERIVAPLVGAKSSSYVVVDPDHHAWYTGGRSRGTDAELAVDVEVGPDHPLTIHVPLVRQQRICTEGGELGADAWPTVRFRAWGRTFERSSGEDLLLEYPKADTSGCA